jgi:hypothetical protein
MKPKKIELKLTKAKKKLGKVTEKISRLESKLVKSKKTGKNREPAKAAPFPDPKTTSANIATTKTKS